jgi:protein-S-isoprenylcysteine O-methyltransferase Ste14
MNSKTILARAIECIVFIFGAFGGFFLKIAPPDELKLNFPVGISSFLSLFMLLLIGSLSRKYPDKRYSGRWYIVSIACMLVALAFSLAYYRNYKNYTFGFPPDNPQTRYVQGRQLTQKARDYMKSAHITNIAQVVDDFGGPGSRSEVWEGPSIDAAGTILLVNYVLLVFFFMTALFSLTETVLLRDS